MGAGGTGRGGTAAKIGGGERVDPIHSQLGVVPKALGAGRAPRTPEKEDGAGPY